MERLLYLSLGASAVLAGLPALGSRFGFTAQRPADYAGQEPAFDLRRHLSGRLACDGAIFGPLGRVESRFNATFLAGWEGNRCTLTEHFVYASGREMNRVWSLSLGNDGAIRATAPDVEGTATGKQRGSAVSLRYRLRLPDDAGGHLLSVNDWMYLLPDGTIINRSQFRKFGLKVAELVATIRHVPE
jgi:hypothetical protein